MTHMVYSVDFITQDDGFDTWHLPGTLRLRGCNTCRHVLGGQAHEQGN
jgi:hypothetical protein